MQKPSSRGVDDRFSIYPFSGISPCDGLKPIMPYDRLLSACLVWLI